MIFHLQFFCQNVEDIINNMMHEVQTCPKFGNDWINYAPDFICVEFGVLRFRKLKNNV